jgi:tripartite-type tricarboxylate transporter receptor subunit TctC
VARAACDGHTLLRQHIGMSTMPALVRNLPFTVENDFECLGMVSEVPRTLIGRPSLPADRRLEPSAHRTFVTAEIARWSSALKAAGVYAD